MPQFGNSAIRQFGIFGYFILPCPIVFLKSYPQLIFSEPANEKLEKKFTRAYRAIFGNEVKNR